MSLSVKHVNVPEGFEFSVEMRTDDGLLGAIYKYYNPEQLIRIGHNTYAIPDTGIYTWDTIDCWVYNQEKQGYMVLYFKSIEAYKF